MDSAGLRDRLLGLDRRSGVRLYLVRHGEAANVSDGIFRYNGHIDVDVSPRGMTQMEGIAAYLKDKEISAVYSSDLLRARRGAEAIARYHDLPILSPPHPIFRGLQSISRREVSRYLQEHLMSQRPQFSASPEARN